MMSSSSATRMPRPLNPRVHRLAWAARKGSVPPPHIVVTQQQPSSAQWTARDLDIFMTDGRDWQAVEQFYRGVVAGTASLCQLGLEAASSGVEAVHRQHSTGPDQLRALASSGQGDDFHGCTDQQVLNALSGSAQSLSLALQRAKRSRDVRTMGGSTARPDDCSFDAGFEAVAADAEVQHCSTSGHADNGNTGVGGTSLAAAWLPHTAPVVDVATQRSERRARKRARDQRPRITYQVELCYFGPAFCGWMQQPGGVATVEGAVTAAVKELVPNGTPRSAIASAGRTDKGVSAAAQVFSFYTREDLSADAIMAAVQRQAEGGVLRVAGVARRERSFHATFSALHRRYVYLFPLREGLHCSNAAADGGRAGGDAGADIGVDAVNAMLKRLEGKTLDYTALARDTPAGKACDCTLHVAAATMATLPSSTAGAGTDVLCIELIADRFLRRMVRILVSTVVQLAAEQRMQGAASSATPESRGAPKGSLPDAREDADALLCLVLTQDRISTARLPAPALGLCFAGVGYEPNPDTRLS